MSHNVQKYTFITILLLLLIFASLSAAGIYFKFFHEPNHEILENKEHKFFFDNKLWFYDQNEELLGTYQCETSNCGYAINFQSDADYAIESFKVEEETEIPIIHDQYVFLRDFEDPSSHEAFLYDIKTGTAYKSITYASVKNYGIGISDDIFIVENSSHKYNALMVSSTLNPLFDFEYDFIGLVGALDENDKVLADYFVTLKKGVWNILDRSGAVLTNDIEEEIANFNGSYIITRSQDKTYHIRNYQNELVLEEDFKSLSFTDRYLNCRTSFEEFYVYDLNSKTIISEELLLESEDEVSTRLNEEGNLDIYINGTLKDTILL